MTVRAFLNTVYFPAPRLLLALPAILILALGGCSNLTQKQYESCVFGLTAAGGATGGAASGGSAIVPSMAVGAAVSAIICGNTDVTSAPVESAMVAVDSDSDGVTDDMDRCNNTPAGAVVDRNGCALDSDNDGVPDHKDQCRGTPSNVRVDDVGCPLKDEVVLSVDRLAFIFNSAELNSTSRSALDQVVSVIRSHSSVNLEVVGYTDSSGPESYNQKLSERRAAAVVDYLVSRGIPSSGLVSSGKGESNPVASNETRDGRERNRRVELVVR